MGGGGGGGEESLSRIPNKFNVSFLAVTWEFPAIGSLGHLFPDRFLRLVPFLPPDRAPPPGLRRILP